MKNNFTNIKKWQSNIVSWTIAVLLVLPIVLLPLNFQPHDWSRAILFRVIITALVAFLIFRFFYKKDIAFHFPKWNRTACLPLLILAAFLFSLIIATVFSEDISFSIFGSPARSGGILNLLFFFLFSILLALFINENQWEKLFRVLCVTGILASLLAIAQYFNLFKNIFLSYGEGSTPSFLGNSTFLATYILFLSFLAIALFIQKQHKREKLFYGASFLLFALTIFVTGSRAAYLGLLVGFLYFFLFYPVRSKEPLAPADASTNRTFNGAGPYRKKYKMLKMGAISFLIIVLLTVALFNFLPQLGEKSGILKTISTRVSIEKIIKDISGTRLSSWKMTWRAIQDKPLLGWGPENFYIGFEQYYDPTPFATPKLLWDRPHNAFLEIWVNAGIFSLLFYILFWIVLFWQLQRFKKSQKNTDENPGSTAKLTTGQDTQQHRNILMAHGVQAMFIGYLIVLFFNFDSFATYLISFFFIGYSFYLIFLKKEKITLLPPRKSFLKNKLLLTSFFAILLIFIWVWNIKPLYLHDKIAHAKNLSEQRNCKKALDLSNNENWEKSGILKSYAILEYSSIVKNCISAEPDKEVEYSKKMVSLLKVAAKSQPAFSRTWLFMGGFTNVLAAGEENPDTRNKLLAESMEYLKRAVELSPKRQEAFAQMQKNYLVAEDYASMEILGKECIAIDSRFGECYWYLGVAQVFLGNQEDGKKNIELALKNGYHEPPYKQLAIAYMSHENWKEAVEAYAKIPIYYNFNHIAASHHATLAYLYKQSGDYTKALENALKVFKLQPENPETIPFIESLLEKIPNDQFLNSSLAFIYSQPGPYQNQKKAIATYWRLIRSNPSVVHYYSEIANIYLELGEYDQAYNQTIMILKLFPIQKKNVENFIKTKLPTTYWEKYNYGN